MFYVPDDHNGTEEYTSVKLTIDGKQTECFSLDDLIKTERTYYCYGATELSGGSLISGWQMPVSGSDPIAGRTLYFSSGEFSFNDKIYIGDNEGELSERYVGSVNTLYYTIPDELEADQNTIITIIHESKTYHFLWKELAKNKVAVSNDVG